MAFDLSFEPFPGPDGPLAGAFIPWDSELFGFPWYEVKGAGANPDAVRRHLGAWLDGLPRDSACMVAARLPPERVSAAEALARHGFYPVEILVDFDLVLARLRSIARPGAGRYRFREARPDDLPALQEIAGQAFGADRFHLDPHLPPARCGERYARWVGASFRAGEPIRVLEETAGGRVAGFIQCRDRAPGDLDVCLGAVRPDLHNSGAGVLMYQCLFLDARSRGYTRAATHVSMNNLRGIKLTLGYGFTVSRATLCMHWFRAAPP